MLRITTLFRLTQLPAAVVVWALALSGAANGRAAAELTTPVKPGETIRVLAAGCVSLSSNLVCEPVRREAGAALPFSQSAIVQRTNEAALGPDPSKPCFNARFALPVPPDNDTNLTGALLGLDAAVWSHNHSPGLEVLPNGDVLAVYFSARDSTGRNESDPSTRFVQARLRHGAEQWDPPELFLDFPDANDQSALLWRDGNQIRFFGGGRGGPASLPFKLAVSTNNGAGWLLSLPLLDRPASDFTPQPIANAFRADGGAMFFAMDADKDNSFLWRSDDNGVHWRDAGGRTTGRHSTIIPLDADRALLSIGGKNSSLNGWTPMNVSSNAGLTWSEPRPAPFPDLASNQRPCLIRLANGHLCFVSDSYNRKSGVPKDGWPHGAGCFVAISKDNGQTWRIKPLPVVLPHELDRKSGTLGYATVRQAPNGLIHVLATMTHPCLHYEFNEAWVESDVTELPLTCEGGERRTFREDYPDGTPRSTWSALVCPDGRYLLDGRKTTYYPDGKKEYDATFARGVKSGTEIFWAPDGTKVWTWTPMPESNAAVWTQYWPNGRKRVESTWTTKPRARDTGREFTGLVAEGPSCLWHSDGSPDRAVSFRNGTLGADLPPPPAQP